MKSNKSIFLRGNAFPFLKLQKMEFVQKIFREIDLFDFTSFFGLDFFKISGLLCDQKLMIII